MDALQSIGTFFGSGAGSSLLKLGELGMAGSGLVGNILNERARSAELGRLTGAEKTLADPSALAKQVAAATQPLNSGLVQGVENQVSGDLAEKGLAQAPGIQAATLAQALAPFEQQNQNTALQLVLTRLGLPLDYAKTILAGMPQNANLAPLLALLQKGPGSSTSGIDAGALLKMFQNPASAGDPSMFDFSGASLVPPPDSSSMGDFSLPNDIWG